MLLIPLLVTLSHNHHHHHRNHRDQLIIIFKTQELGPTFNTEIILHFSRHWNVEILPVYALSRHFNTIRLVTALVVFTSLGGLSLLVVCYGS